MSILIKVKLSQSLVGIRIEQRASNGRATDEQRASNERESVIKIAAIESTVPSTPIDGIA